MRLLMTERYDDTFPDGAKFCLQTGPKTLEWKLFSGIEPMQRLQSGDADKSD